MELKVAYDNLRKYNPILKPLPNGSPLWKKVVIEIIDSYPIDEEILKSAIVVGGSLEDKDVTDKMYEFFKRITDDNLRKLIVESWSSNINEKVIDVQFELIGIREKPMDRYVRQIASQNIINAFKKISEENALKAHSIILKLKKSLNSENTFTRMNSVIIMRSINNKNLLYDLEKRLAVEKKLLSSGSQDVGIPYVIRELEKSITFYKERA